jgi:hypothetical protein
MIAAVIRFAISLIVGGLAAVVAGIAILNRPPPERERPIYSAIGAGPARTTGPETPYEFLQRRLR